MCNKHTFKSIDADCGPLTSFRNNYSTQSNYSHATSAYTPSVAIGKVEISSYVPLSKIISTVPTEYTKQNNYTK